MEAMHDSKGSRVRGLESASEIRRVKGLSPLIDQAQKLSEPRLDKRSRPSVSITARLYQLTALILILRTDRHYPSARPAISLYTTFSLTHIRCVYA